MLTRPKLIDPLQMARGMGPVWRHCLRSAAVPRSPASNTRDTGAIALATASVISGVFAYLFIAIGTRQFGTSGFSGVAQLWTIWFFGSSVLTFPIQHWVIQRLRIDGHGGAVRVVLPRLMLFALGLGLAVVAVTFLVRGDMYGRDDIAYPLIAGGITVGAAAMGLLRGGLAGRSRFLATATALAGENVVRFACGLAVVAAGATVGWYGAAILSGSLVILAWPSALRFDGPAMPGVSPVAFLGNVGGGTVIAQSVLTAGPVVLGLAGGTRDEVTSLFTALALFRAPYIVALGLAIRMTATLTDLVAAGRSDDLRRIQRRMIARGRGPHGRGRGRGGPRRARRAPPDLRRRGRSHPGGLCRPGDRQPRRPGHAGPDPGADDRRSRSARVADVGDRVGRRGRRYGGAAPRTPSPGRRGLPRQ